MPTPARKPADRREPDGDRRFSFTHRGEEHTFPEPVSTITSPGFIRRNRKLDEIDFAFTALEALAGDSKEGQAVLEVIDDMTAEEFDAMSEALWKFSDVPVGESGPSPS